MKKITFVFSGPSGSGKTTIIQYLLGKFSTAGATVSCTTRQIRSGEKDGVNYHFISNKEFERLISNDEFMEYVECYGYKYGTLRNSVMNVLQTKKFCILDLEFSGAAKLLSEKYSNFECIGVLILPPSISKLKARLLSRRSETNESLQRRLLESFAVNRIANYQHVVVNCDLQSAKTEVENILQMYS
jgi:guanylate kinase